jgi:hypothetical protein
LGSRTTAMFGVGLMASGGMQTLDNSVNGTEKKGVEKVKERLTDFTHNLKRQLYLDKLMPSKKKTEKTDDDQATNGVGNVQYFNHPNAQEGELNGNEELDFSEANKLELQLEESAKQFEEQQRMSSHYTSAPTNEINGFENDVTDRLM